MTNNETAEQRRASASDTEARDLRAFGFAPGYYLCNCMGCKRQFLGGKWSWRCKECALECAPPRSTHTEARDHNNTIERLTREIAEAETQREEMRRSRMEECEFLRSEARKAVKERDEARAAAIEEAAPMRMALEDAVAALTELCQWGGASGDCWCEAPARGDDMHSPGCKAAKLALPNIRRALAAAPEAEERSDG